MFENVEKFLISVMLFNLGPPKNTETPKCDCGYGKYTILVFLT